MQLRLKQTRISAATTMIIAAFAVVSFQTAGAQSNDAKGSAGAKAKTAGAAAANANTPDVAKTLRVAAETLGLARWSGVGGQHLPEVDIVSTMEFWASGTTYGSGQSYKDGEPWPAFKTEYHATLGYNPPAVRLEMTRTPVQGGGGPQQAIQVVREKYAWDESELGAGLVPGKGIATPEMAATRNRLLQLWILPYGVIKAAVAAGDKTKMTTENGATVLTFPLSGLLADVMVRATLDSENEVAKVETRTDNPALRELMTETEYSGYTDHGEILTDVKSPGHILQKQGGHPVMDIQVKMWDANNPYLVFPVPENVKKFPAS
jgi:hypothetical protein